MKNQMNQLVSKPGLMSVLVKILKKNILQNFKIIQKENIQETELKYNNYNSQNTTEKIYKNSSIDFTDAKMK